MEIAIIIFFIGAFIALGLLAIVIFVFRLLLKKKKSNPKNFADSRNYTGDYSSNIHDSDDDDYAAYNAPMYYSSNDDSTENKAELHVSAHGIFETNIVPNETTTNYSEASEGAGYAAESSYSESSYTDSSSSSDSSSSYSDSSSSDSSSSSSDSGSSSSWD